MIYGGNSAFSVKVEKNRRCNLSTLGSTIRGCMKAWRTFMKTQERPSQDWARRGSKKTKNSSVSSQAGNRRALAHTGGRPWILTRRPKESKTAAVTGGRLSKQAAARGCGRQNCRFSLSFISFVLIRFYLFLFWDFIYILSIYLLGTLVYLLELIY